MSTFKATDKKKKREDDVFKATSRRTFDSAYIGSIENQATDSLKILDDYIKKRKSGGYVSSKDMDTYEKAFKNYSSSISTLNSFYKTFGIEHNEEETNNWISSLSRDITNSKSYFSKFKNEYEYNDAVKISELYNMPSADILPYLDTSKTKKEKNALVSRQEELEKQLSKLGASGNKGVGAQKKLSLTKELNDVKKQIRNLEESPIAYTTSSGQNITWQSLYDKKKAEEDWNALYTKYSSKNDWKEKTKYVSTQTGTKKAYGKEYGVYADPKYEWINGNGDAVTEEALENPDGNGPSYIYKYYDLLTADEKMLYNYLYFEDKQNGTKSAEKFLTSMEKTLKNRFEGDVIEATVTYTKEHPVVASVFSLGTNIASGVEWVGDLMTGDDSNLSAKLTSSIRGTVSEKVDWEVGDWDVFDFLYGTGMSMADSVAATALFGKAGGVVLGLSAAAQGTNDALDRGMSKGQAFTSGLASGIFECFFETWSIGAFGDLTKNLKRADFRNLAKYVGKNMWNNAKEETLTEIANIAYDYLSNGDFSQYETSIRQYMASGMSESDAKKQVAVELGVQVAEAAGSGALMGFGFGAGGSVGAVSNTIQSGKLIKDAGQTRNLVDLGKSLGEGTESYEFANKITDKSKAYAIGQLLGIAAEDIQSANRGDIVKSLERKGYSTDVANNLAEMMLDPENTMFENSRGISAPGQTYNDIINNPNSTVGQRNEAYEGILRGVAENRLQKSMGKAVENKSATASHKVLVEEEGKPSAQDKKTIESNFESNTEGKDFNVKSGIIIESKKLVSSAKDNMAFEVTYEDGTTETVDANDISFGNDGEALVYSAVMDMNVPVGIAESLINGYKGNDVKSAGTYVNGMREAFTFGKYNQKADLNHGPYASQLTDEQRSNAFKLGGIYAKEKAIADEKAIKGESKPTNIKKQEGKVHFEGDKLSLKSVQDVSLKSLDVLSKALGKDIHIFESYVDENGNRVYKDANGNIKPAPNGFYNQADGSIWIDLNAGNSGQGTMLYTAAHELTHFIKQWSPTKFKALADFLVEQYGKEGVSVHQLVLAQQEKAKKNGREISYDVAFEEMVADSMETMLTDGKVIRELAHKDKGLFNKIKSWIDNLLRKLNMEYKNYSPESNEGQMLREMKKTFEEAQRLFADALVDASDNFAIRGTDKAFVENYLKTKDVVYNLRAAESHQDKLAEKYTTDASIDLETLQERYAKIIGIWEKLGGELNSKFLNEWNNKVGKDRAFTIFKAQAGYKYNVELSSMCKKGVPLFEAIDTIVKKEVMNELKTKTIGKAEKEILYDILKNHNFEIPCAICYVEQARQREGVIINDFLDGKIEKNAKGKVTKYKLGWNDVLNRVEKEMKKNGVDYTFRNVDKSIATDSYAPADIVMDEATQDAFYKALKKVANAEIVRWNREVRKSNQKERRQITDLKPQTIKEAFKGTLPSNLKILKVLFNNPSSRFKMSRDLLYSSATTLNLANAHNDLYSLFNSQGGVAGYKTKQAPIVYWGDILGKSWNPSTVRKEGGIRNQSNSDFQMYTLLDQAQMYIDFSAKGYYLQAYTKVLAELKLFGLSRGKINASLIPQVIEYKNADGSVNWEKTMENAGLDENGNPIYDDFEGINHTEAFMLIEDAEYSKNICGICIGYSDNHIRKLLDDNRVQQIIGFHDKTDNPEKRYRGAKYSKNYNGLNEAVKVKADGTEETVHIGFNQFVSKAEKMFKFNKNTETFEGTVNHNGKEYSANDIPRLAADLYLEMCAEKNYRPAYNDFSSHKNYYKLLADFGLYDSQGNYAPHQKVQYNMPDKVPYLDKNGNKAYMSTESYIKAELQKELTVRDSISEALADTSENGIIPQFVERVNALHTEKADTTLNSDRVTAEEDAEYTDAYFDGDEDLMQELVDKVANRLGYKYKAYHHTENGFTVFDLSKARVNMDIQGFYFSADKDAESEYGSVRYDTYLKMDNPYIVDSAEKRKAIPFDMSKENAGVIAREWLQSQGYDGVIRKAEYFGAEADEYIVFDSTQIKSAEPMTFTDDEYGEGDIIPLSQRFNEENDDIRYSDRDSKGRKLSAEQSKYFKHSKVRDSKGRLIPVYHGTKTAGFTKFTKSDEIGYFFARTINTAKTYSKGSKKIFTPDKNSKDFSGAGIYKGYLNMKKPYIIDGEGAYWNMLEATGEKVRVSIKTSHWNNDGTGRGKITFEYGGKKYSQTIHNNDEFDRFITKHLNSNMARVLAWGMDSKIDKNGKGQFEAGLIWDFSNKESAESKNTRDIVRRAYNSHWNYDGVIFKNIVDSGNASKIKADDVYVIFDSNQFKSAANTHPTPDPDIRYSARNSKGDILTEEQIKFFEDSKVRDADGNLRVMYHGTPNGDFNTFKISDGAHNSLMAQYGAGYYFDSNKDSAQRYTQDVNKSVAKRNPKVFEAYLNIKNPLIIHDEYLNGREPVITKQQFMDVVSKGNYEWMFTNGMPFELTKYLGKSKTEIQQLPREEIIQHWVDMVYDRAYFDSDILSAMVKAYKGDSILGVMKDVFGNDGVKVVDKYGEMWVAWDNSQIKEIANTNPTSDPDIRYSERDYPIDTDVEKTVRSAYVNPKGKMHKLSNITSEQNKAINRLVNQTNNDSYRGKYEGGKHWFADNNIRHIINEHGDFLREGLRAQLPMTLTDIARHLSAVKDNKKPSAIKPTKTKEGYPSILTSYEVNGYTLYAEEIKKSLGNNLPNDLIGHTMYKAPTLPTAAFYTTSVQTQPKRQSEALCEYYMPNSTDLSMGNFVADKNGNPAQLYFVSKNGSAKQDARIAGLVALSSDSANFTDKSGQIAQGYVRCKKPFYITQDNRVFSNSETNVAQKIEELKKQGYDCFIFDKTVGDNYMVAVVNKAQIIADEPTVVYSERDTDSVSTRSLLANALEGAAQNDIEKNKLAQYKEKIALIEAEENKLHELREKLFAKGIKGEERKKIQEEVTRTTNRINIYDRQLFNLESTTALKNVLNREREAARKRQKQKDNENLRAYKEKVAETTRQLLEKNRESRHKAIEGRTKTEMRHKVKKVVNDLNNLLLKPTKERHIPEEMRIAVAEALALVNMDTVDADTRVAKYNELIAKANNPDVIASLTESRDRILNQGNKLGEKLTKLKDAYGMIRDSADDSLKSMYDDVIYNKIESVQKKIGKTPLRNMTLEQLESVYELYTMVLTTVRDSNKAFAEDLKMTRQALGSNTFAEIKENNKARDRIRFEGIENFGWKYLKPMQAMKTIGSGILQKLWNNILYGQEVFAQDYDEAVKFAKEMKEKYGYKKWNLNKLYSFESKSGKLMKINLEQMMSIYAYSKRKQADEHIEFGGVLLNESIIKEKKFGRTVEVKVNDSTAYRLDKLQVGVIIDTLEKEFPGAKDFVDEMQKYLSETMGEKGNEVSMKMYGIKLFKEEHYFPLKSSKDFMEAANAKLKGDVKIKNKGMTKSTVEHANNPIVLEGFLDVWGNHVNEMAMYHGLVLPLEDFSRTLNYGFKADDKLNADAESVRTALRSAFGESADNYLNELLKAINGGVLHDSSSEIADKMISKFKKAKVLASLSVIIQQPTAIIRAMGIIEPKYFTSQNFHHKQTWEELKKYCPTAIIKETGSFDTNMGRTIVDMVKGDRKFTEKVGDALSKAPAWMDEMGWNMIWRALKKKVATEQNLSGEALLKECGKQMTLIINETQVYDSVMSRNELMRSKSALTKMATAFMGEPTTVANMIYGAVLDLKRGNKGMASKTIAAVVSSVVINGLVSSLVYAFRDDDEEKTWLEKYLTSATTEVIDGLNPLTYIPFVKDAYSIFQGYDVERTDMSLIGDVYDALEDFYNVLDPEAYEDMSSEEIAKHIYENSIPLLTSICDMFGLPVGNILRDAEAIIVNDNLSMSKTSSEGSGLAVKEGWLNSSPKIVQKFVDDEKYHKLYLIANNGDAVYVKSEVGKMVAEKVASGNTEKEAKQSVKSSFTSVYRDEYKKAYKNRDIEEMNRIRKFLYATGLWNSLSELDSLLAKWREAD